MDSTDDRHAHQGNDVTSAELIKDANELVLTACRQELRAAIVSSSRAERKQIKKRQEATRAE